MTKGDKVTYVSLSGPAPLEFPAEVLEVHPDNVADVEVLSGGVKHLKLRVPVWTSGPFPSVRIRGQQFFRSYVK